MVRKPKARNKLFVIRKYVRATSAAEAIRMDKRTAVDDVWIDDTWKAENLPGAIGFEVARNEECE
jgi:hypothetical protein